MLRPGKLPNRTANRFTEGEPANVCAPDLPVATEPEGPVRRPGIRGGGEGAPGWPAGCPPGCPEGNLSMCARQTCPSAPMRATAASGVPGGPSAEDQRRGPAPRGRRRDQTGRVEVAGPVAQVDSRDSAAADSHRSTPIEQPLAPLVPKPQAPGAPGPSPPSALPRTGWSGAHTFAGFPPGNLLAVPLASAVCAIHHGAWLSNRRPAVAAPVGTRRSPPQRVYRCADGDGVTTVREGETRCGR